MIEQLLLPFTHPRLYDNELVFSAANYDVLMWFQNYAAWPMHQVILTGEAQSGKTTWLSMVKKKCNALLLDGKTDILPPISELSLNDVLIDNSEHAPQEWLFHLINHQHRHKKRLTFTSIEPVQEWDFETQDLESRMRAFYPIAIAPLQEGEAVFLMHKLFYDRGIPFDANVIQYFLNRIERSYRSYSDLVTALDTFLLCSKKSLTLLTARDFLKTYQRS